MKDAGFEVSGWGVLQLQFLCGVLKRRCGWLISQHVKMNWLGAHDVWSTHMQCCTQNRMIHEIEAAAENFESGLCRIAHIWVSEVIWSNFVHHVSAHELLVGI